MPVMLAVCNAAWIAALRIPVGPANCRLRQLTSRRCKQVHQRQRRHSWIVRLADMSRSMCRCPFLLVSDVFLVMSGIAMAARCGSGVHVLAFGAQLVARLVGYRWALILLMSHASLLP